MFHFKVFSIGIPENCKSNDYLLLLATLSDMKVTEFWSVIYICPVYKVKLFWTHLTFWETFMTDP